MTHSLQTALQAASPRLGRRPTPFLSVLIYGGVLGLWLALFGGAFRFDNVLVWSAGIVYILYDTALMALVGWHASRSAAGAPLVTTPVVRPTLGVVIAAHNEAVVLPATLDALCAQSDRADHIVIADDGSSDDTARILVERYGLAAAPIGEMSSGSVAYPFMHWLRLTQAGKAEALNAAIVQTGTDIVVTIDADTIPASDAIAVMRAAFAADQTLVAAGGILRPVCDATVSGAILQWFQTYEYIRNIVSRFAWMRIESLVLISGAFAAFRRDALLAVGGFDRECLVEDYELTHRLHRYAVDHGLHWRLAVIGAAHADTHAPGTVAAFLLQRRRWFAGFLQTQFWNRDITGNARFGRLGTIMMPIKALDTLQPIYGLTAFILLVALIVSGRLDIAIPVFGIITAKIIADFIFNIWMIALYRRLSGDRSVASLGGGIVAAALEPFSFQLLRHAGAAWGWLTFLTGTHSWGLQRRNATRPFSGQTETPRGDVG